MYNKPVKSVIQFIKQMFHHLLDKSLPIVPISKTPIDCSTNMVIKYLDFLPHQDIEKLD